MDCITSTSYSVRINGILGRQFQPTRGLCQGDPLSPFLFLLCAEGLSALLRLAISKRDLRGLKASRSGPTVSHLLFANDSIIFGDATTEDVKVLQKVFTDYEGC